jgi:Avidin family
MAAKKSDPRSAKVSSVSSPNFGGTWANELGSEMTLTVRGTEVSGTYTSKVSREVAGKGGGPTPASPLVGFVNGDQMSFVVNWGTKYASLTAWVGQLVSVDGVETIRTLWHLTQNVDEDDEPTGLWHSVLTGADNFTRKTP